MATRVPGRGNVTQASCSAEIGQVYSKVLTNVLSASASTTARSPSRSIFVQAIQASVQAKASAIHDKVTISISGVNATTSAGTIGERVSVSPRVVISALTNPIIHQVSIACPSALASTTFRMGKISHIVSVLASSVTASASTRSFLPSFVPSVSPVHANAQAKSTANYLSILVPRVVATAGVGKTPGGPPAYSVSVTASVGSVSKSLFAFALPAPVAATTFHVTPTPRIAISGVHATAVARDTWGAGVPSEAYCWTVLGVLTLQIKSIWEPGRGVFLRGEMAQASLKGMSDDATLRGKSDEVSLRGMSDETKLRGRDSVYSGKGAIWINIKE